MTKIIRLSKVLLALEFTFDELAQGMFTLFEYNVITNIRSTPDSYYITYRSDNGNFLDLLEMNENEPS